MDKENHAAARGESWDDPYFYRSPAPLMELDLTPVVTAIDSLPARRFADVMEAFNSGRIDPGMLTKADLFIRANDAMVSLLGASSSEELSERFDEALPTESFPAMIAGVLAMRNSTEPYRVETYNYRLDGTKLHVRLVMRRCTDDDALRRVLVHAIDITSDVSLRAQIQSLAMMPETNPNIVLMMECEAQVTYANPTARRWLTERDKSDLNELQQLLPVGFHERYCVACDRKTPRGEVYERDQRLYDLKITPVVGDRRCVLYVNDITETVNVRLERDTYFRAIEASGNAIAITNRSGALEYTNPAFEKLYGMKRDSTKGENPRIVNPGRRAYWDMGVSETEYQDLFRGMWARLAEDGFWEGDVLNRVVGGDVHWIHLIMNRIDFHDGAETKYLAVGTDLDEMRRSELNARLEILQTITRVAELRDNETGRHMYRVGQYARLLAEQLHQPRRFTTEVERFAPLHDIGKVGIGDEVLLAPRKLTPAEFATIKQHTTLGYSILAGKPSLEMAADIARDHHERYDGTGYPQGKQGSEIPFSARIVSVCDVYDALRSVRPYKSAWSHDDTRREIVANAGTQFCPEVVTAFEAIHGEFNEVKERYGDD